ncbi:Deoxyribose-phosphate aldolase [Peptoniphilus sp. ING2-D1G]|nr:Deoxyribose-phosphate aldolase [Peptoniphilus sp. ING2-D1G]
MNLNKMIDHTLLKPEAKEEDIKKLCEEALKYDFKSVCVNPCWVELVSELLSKSDIKTCVVVGFPLGASDSKVKEFEAKIAIEKGAEEIDMVINIGFLKSKKYDLVESEIKNIVKISRGRIVKVILETCLLDKEEIVQACEICTRAGVDFVKTSTGFSTAGANIDDVKLMRENISEKMQVKASGGIRNLETALGMINAGATRIGSSSGVSIMEEYNYEN